LNILVALEGVLCSEQKTPNRTGILFYYWLAANNRVALLTSWDKKDAEFWLMSNGIIDYAELIDDSYALLGEDLSRRQITIARSRQPIELLLTADPSLAAWAFEQGIPSLLFAHPDSIGIANRPGMRAWGEIEEAITQKHIKRSLDVQKEHSMYTD
jgi:hypothetical protein